MISAASLAPIPGNALILLEYISRAGGRASIIVPISPDEGGRAAHRDRQAKKVTFRSIRRGELGLLLPRGAGPGEDIGRSRIRSIVVVAVGALADAQVQPLQLDAALLHVLRRRPVPVADPVELDGPAARAERERREEERHEAVARPLAHFS